MLPQLLVTLGSQKMELIAEHWDKQKTLLRSQLEEETLLEDASCYFRMKQQDGGMGYVPTMRVVGTFPDHQLVGNRESDCCHSLSRHNHCPSE